MWVCQWMKSHLMVDKRGHGAFWCLICTASCCHPRPPTMQGGVSGGTLASGMNLAEERGKNPEAVEAASGVYALVPPEAKGKDQDSWGVEWNPDLHRWLAPFVMQVRVGSGPWRWLGSLTAWRCGAWAYKLGTRALAGAEPAAPYLCASLPTLFNPAAGHTLPCPALPHPLVTGHQLQSGGALQLLFEIRPRLLLRGAHRGGQLAGSPHDPARHLGCNGPAVVDLGPPTAEEVAAGTGGGAQPGDHDERALPSCCAGVHSGAGGQAANGGARRCRGGGDSSCVQHCAEWGLCLWRAAGGRGIVLGAARVHPWKHTALSPACAPAGLCVLLFLFPFAWEKRRCVLPFQGCTPPPPPRGVLSCCCCPPSPPSPHRAEVGDPNRDGGYWGTARMLLEAALCLALQQQDLDADPRCIKGGVLTPASALGATYLDRLRKARLSFEIKGEEPAAS